MGIDGACQFFMRSLKEFYTASTFPSEKTQDKFILFKSLHSHSM